MSWFNRRKTLALLGFGLPILAGCGFRPLYSEGSPSVAIIGRIAISPVDGRMGYVFREQLETRLGPPAQADYTLHVKLDVTSDSRAIAQDNSIRRFNLRCVAAYELVRAGEETPVYADEATSFTGYSATASAFATRAAEQDARDRLATTLADQIALRLSSTAQRWLR